MMKIFLCTREVKTGKSDHLGREKKIFLNLPLSPFPLSESPSLTPEGLTQFFTQHICIEQLSDPRQYSGAGDTAINKTDKIPAF